MSTTPRVPIVPTGTEGQTRLSDEAELTGKVTGGDFAVQGHVEGDIVLTGWLRVGRAGRVNGNVQAAAAEIGGAFDGELRARVLVFTETAQARGRFLSDRLVIREGAHVDGAFDTLPAPGETEPQAAAVAEEDDRADEALDDQDEPSQAESESVAAVATDDPADDDSASEEQADAESAGEDDEPRPQE